MTFHCVVCVTTVIQDVCWLLWTQLYSSMYYAAVNIFQPSVLAVVRSLTYQNIHDAKPTVCTDLFHRCIRNDRHYALICTPPLFYVLAPTCFGSSLPSSGSFLDPELLEIQIEWVVYHIICGYVTCVPDCHGSICCASHLRTMTIQHTGHITTHYMIYHPFDLYFK
jgi:hypothetical protein